MDRASSLLQNASSEPKKEEHSSKRAQRKQRKEVKEVKEDPESLEWSEEEIYLASMDYDRYMDTNVKRELRGVDARENLDFLQKAKSREAAGQCQIMGLGHCSTPFYSSSAWELASQSDGTKGFDTTEYQGWVQAAWAKCLAKDRAWDFGSLHVLSCLALGISHTTLLGNWMFTIIASSRCIACIFSALSMPLCSQTMPFGDI